MTNRTPLPYLPHELDKHPDVGKIRATMKLAIDNAYLDRVELIEDQVAEIGVLRLATVDTLRTIEEKIKELGT